MIASCFPFFKGLIRTPRVSKSVIVVCALMLFGASGCSGGSEGGVAPATSLSELISRYFNALSAGDERTACALTDRKAVRTFERTEKLTCEAYLAEMSRSWGPNTRKLVAKIEVGGDPEYREGLGGWSALDPLAPLIIDLPDSEVRALLGPELKTFDRTAKLESLDRTTDPEFQTVFDVYGIDHPATYSLLDHIQGLSLSADDQLYRSGKRDTAVTVIGSTSRNERWTISIVDGYRMVPKT